MVAFAGVLRAEETLAARALNLPSGLDFQFHPHSPKILVKLLDLLCLQVKATPNATVT